MQTTKGHPLRAKSHLAGAGCLFWLHSRTIACATSRMAFAICFAALPATGVELFPMWEEKIIRGIIEFITEII